MGGGGKSMGIQKLKLLGRRTEPKSHSVGVRGKTPWSCCILRLRNSCIARAYRGNRSPGRPKWGRKWSKFEEKWEKLQENEERMRKCSNLAHPGVRGWLRPCWGCVKNPQIFTLCLLTFLPFSCCFPSLFPFLISSFSLRGDAPCPPYNDATPEFTSEISQKQHSTLPIIILLLWHQVISSSTVKPNPTLPMDKLPTKSD